MEENKNVCEYCGGDKAIRNPSGRCDHLYYPDNVNKNLKNGICQNCETIAPGHAIKINEFGDCSDCGRPVALKWRGTTQIKIGPMTATEIMLLRGEIKHEATAGRIYLKRTGATMPPDRVKEILHLKTSAATLGRKFRASATGDNPQLKRVMMESESGRAVCHYYWNPEYKETI